ncbi:MAG: hypothetical protein ACE5F1_09605 [Planctomycetota bacterium]
MCKLSGLIVASAFLLSAADAQTVTRVVIPSSRASTEGTAMSLLPFGHDRAKLVQYLGQSLHRIPANKTITEIAYRRDGAFEPKLILQRRNNRTTVNPFWAIFMGNSLVNARNPSAAYPCDVRNPRCRSSNKVSLVFQKQVVFPALPAITTGPGAFLIRFKLDTPFVHRGGTLAIVHYVYETRGVIYPTYLADAERGKIDSGSWKAIGVSCPSGSNRAYASSTNPGGADPLRLQLFDAPPKSIAVALLGVSKTRWGLITLPADLKTIGLSGCSLYSSVNLLVAVATLSTGSALFESKVPNDASMAGATFYGQWMTVDNRVNPAVGLAFSNGLEITLGKSLGAGAGLDASFVYGTQNAQAVNGPVGFVDRGITLVTEISYR